MQTETALPSACSCLRFLDPIVWVRPRLPQ